MVNPGTIEPAGLCSALTRYATNRGAKVIENCAVESILTEPTSLNGKRVTEVVTSRGTIKTQNVVNATGTNHLHTSICFVVVAC